MRLENKVAVITGGASGMGLATAMRFLEEGARVVIADYNAETGNAALATADGAGYRGLASFIRTDVASEPDVEAMLQRALDEYGGLDIVFNNAGVGGAVGPLTETTVSDWDYTFDVLAKGVFLGIKHAARIMKSAGKGGSIINTASVAGLSGDGGPLVYSAAKAAVISLSKSAAVELASDLIRVNAICPGFIATPLSAGTRPGSDGDDLDPTQGGLCQVPALAGVRHGQPRGRRRALPRERRFRVRDGRDDSGRWRSHRRWAGAVAEVSARFKQERQGLRRHERLHGRAQRDQETGLAVPM